MAAARLRDSPSPIHAVERRIFDRREGPKQVTLTTPEAGAVAPATKDANSQTAQAATTARGRAVYVEQRCRVCHSIGGEGNTRSPLDGVSARLTENEIRLWIVAPHEMDPAVSKRAYQLSDEDLNALVAYLTASSHRYAIVYRPSRRFDASDPIAILIVVA